MKPYPADYKPELMRMLTAEGPLPTPPYQLPNPGPRSVGLGQRVHLNVMSDKPVVVEIATGVSPTPNTVDFIKTILAATDSVLTVNIDCWGGRGVAGLAIAKALASHPWHVTTRIIGHCASSAVLLAAAGDTREIAPDATVRVHGARFIMTPEAYDVLRQRPDHAVIQQRLADIDAVMAAFLAQRTGAALGVVQKWLRKDQEWDAKAALKNGLVTSINPAISGSKVERLSHPPIGFSLGRFYAAGQAVRSHDKVYVTQSAGWGLPSHQPENCPSDYLLVR